MRTETNPDICFVYVLTFPNGKRYVGVSADPAERFKQHQRAPTPCGRAFAKYGEPVLTVLLKSSRAYCLEVEAKLTRLWSTVVPDGYNLQEGGLGGSIPSQESRERMRRAQTGRRASEETRRKMSEAQRKRPAATAETRERQRVAAQRRGIPRATQEAGVAARLAHGKPLDRRAHSERMKKWWSDRRAAL